MTNETKLPQCQHPHCDNPVKRKGRKFCSTECYNKYQNKYKASGWHKANDAAFKNKYQRFGKLNKIYERVDVKNNILPSDDELLSNIR